MKRSSSGRAKKRLVWVLAATRRTMDETLHEFFEPTDAVIRGGRALAAYVLGKIRRG